MLEVLCIQGHEALVVQEGEGMSPLRYTLIARDSYVFGILYWPEIAELEAVYGVMVSTFRFLDCCLEQRSALTATAALDALE